jgi:CheY-like chemotaxis protein
MSEFSLLIVDDDAQDRRNCSNAVKDYNSENETKIQLVECASVQEAIAELNNSYFDGAIVDMRLADNGDEGNEVLHQIRDQLRRIPIAVVTGTPDSVDGIDVPIVGVYIKGETSYADVVNTLLEIYCTGLTKIMGGKGIIEKCLTDIFINNLLRPESMPRWIYYGQGDSERTEQAMLRHVVNHLIQHLDDGTNKSYPEEFYIYPPISKAIKTGSLVRNLGSGAHFIVMNPACDLEQRDTGSCNTDRALLVEIESLQNIFPNFKWDELSKNNIADLAKVYKNKKSLYYHCLPRTDFFQGGVANFRNISTYTGDDMKVTFSEPEVQVSHAFLKDIVSRFSSYYARQGQPDIDHDLFLT